MSWLCFESGNSHRSNSFLPLPRFRSRPDLKSRETHRDNREDPLTQHPWISVEFAELMAHWFPLLLRSFSRLFNCFCICMILEVPPINTNKPMDYI